jgi:hypothetical protein
MTARIVLKSLRRLNAPVVWPGTCRECKLGHAAN